MSHLGNTLTLKALSYAPLQTALWKVPLQQRFHFRQRFWFQAPLQTALSLKRCLFPTLGSTFPLQVALFPTSDNTFLFKHCLMFTEFFKYKTYFHLPKALPIYTINFHQILTIFCTRFSPHFAPDLVASIYITTT